MNSLPRRAELLRIPSLLIPALKHGEIILQTNGTDEVELRIEDSTIDLNFLKKQALKTLLELEAERKEEPILKKLRTLKDLADTLRHNGFTLTISHLSKKLITLGSGAKPTVSQTITGTEAIEINNLLELLKLTT